MSSNINREKWRKLGKQLSWFVGLYIVSVLAYGSFELLVHYLMGA